MFIEGMIWNKISFSISWGRGGEGRGGGWIRYDYKSKKEKGTGFVWSTKTFQ